LKGNKSVENEPRRKRSSAEINGERRRRKERDKNKEGGDRRTMSRERVYGINCAKRFHDVVILLNEILNHGFGM